MRFNGGIVTDYKQYISFDVENLVHFYDNNFHRDIEDIKPLSQELRQSVERALGEFVTTAEGLELLIEASSLSQDGLITIGFHEDGFSFANDGGGTRHFLIGADEASEKYEASEGDYHLSLQRVLFHELSHLTRSETEGSREVEAAVIKETNAFMKKYYNEDPRLDHYGGDSGGTPHWDVSPDFRAEGYDPNNPEITMFGVWQKIGSMWQEFAFGGMSPELQSLYEHRNDFEAFQRQWNELMENGGIDALQEELNDIIAIEPEPVERLLDLEGSVPSAAFEAPQR